MSKVHELKTWPQFFNPILRGEKTFEFRKNDRDFKKGDKLLLREYDPFYNSYTTRELLVLVSYILHGGQFEIPKGYVIIAIILPQ